MKRFYTIPAERMTKSSQSLATLGSTFYGWDVFPGGYAGKAALFARVHYSWTGMTNGGALTCRVTALPTSAPATSEQNLLVIHLTQSYGTTFGAGAVTSSLLASGGSADGFESIDVCAMPYAATAAIGSILPLPPFWTLRLSNGGTAFGAGTLTIDRVEFYG